MKFGLTEEIYNKIKEIIKKFNKYQFKIFGSRARGDYKKNSDIDIAVYGEITKEDAFSILNEFDLLDTSYSIDIVFVKDLEKQELIKEIEKYGKEF
jgi:hypothetical protein